MNVEYSLNEKKKGVELHFSEQPSKEQAAHLEASGFEEAYKQPLKWYAKQHPAFITFAKNLKSTLLKGEPFADVIIHPSFEPSPENIDHNKFSYVTISFKEGGETKSENYVLFDSYKVVSNIVATRFGKKRYGSAFKEVDVTPRNYKVVSRELLKQGKVINGDFGSEPVKEADKESDNYPGEPLANEHGVYTKELAGKNFEEIIIPIPKIAKFETRISLAKGTDGLYRYGISISSHWQGIGGHSFAPNVNSQSFKDRKQVLKEALNNIAGNTLNNEKAYKAIEQFANEQGIELYKAEETSEPELPEQEIRNQAWQFTKDEAEHLLNENRETSETRLRLLNSWTFHNKETGFEELKEDAPLAARIAEGEVQVRGSLSNKSHKQAVKEALEEGKPVPQIVLDDYPDLTETEEIEPTGIGGQLIKMGFEGLFTATQAFEKPFKVADLQSRWYDTLGHFDQQYEKPAVEQIQRWETVLKALKGQKDKASKEQRETLKVKISNTAGELSKIKALIDDENLAFQQQIVDQSIERARKLGYGITEENKTDFSVKTSEGLFNERMIEPYFQRPIPEIVDELIKDFFKEPVVIEQSKPESNGVEKNLADNPILDMDDAWTMTPLEYQQVKAIEKTGSAMILDAKDRRNHEAIVRQAIEDGRNIPQRVLDHYPWLEKGTSNKPEPKQAPVPLKTDKLKSFAQFLSHYKTIDGHDNDGALKETFGKMGKAAFKQLAAYLGLKEFKADFNKAGVAVSGDLTLMGMFEPGKGIYISFNKDGFSNGVLYRTISHMKDYSGGSNNYFPETEFATPETIKAKVFRLVGIKEQAIPEAAPSPSPPSKAKADYIDRVVAHMHDRYAKGERPTKKQIELLKEQLDVPNLGMMWEAVELSWLLWYKQMYKEPIPFEQRLHKMVHFWHEQQPTYAYSDSSKELYKQYSTPCPIGAMVAQYTDMDNARSIFEPSAGNGLLVIGADPRKTHVNEIDPTRLASLKFQRFQKITSDNAIEPFPENMTKAYDVVVTNPPFARWEEAKFDKELVIRKYFNNHIGLAGNIRLEHLMAGLALHTMKDTGKAAIIIMGHVYFARDGFIAKYRPFFNWLYRHYIVDDVINMNSFKLYNKQGAIERTMLILIGGRKLIPKGVAPQQHEAPYLYDMVNDFPELWYRIKSRMGLSIHTIINQLQIELQA